MAEAEVEVVAPDGQPLHVRDLDGRGQPDDQPSLKKSGSGVRFRVRLFVRRLNLVTITSVRTWGMSSY